MQICYCSFLWEENPPGQGFVDVGRASAVTLLPTEVNKVTVDSLFQISYWYSLNKSRDVAVQQQGVWEVELWSVPFSEEVQTTGKEKKKKSILDSDS